MYVQYEQTQSLAHDKKNNKRKSVKLHYERDIMQRPP